MVNILLLSLQIRFTIIANRLINFLSRIPLVRKVFGTRLYGEYGVKTVLTIFGAIFIAVKRIFSRVFYVGFIVFTGFILYVTSLYGGYREIFAAITTDEIGYGIQIVASEVIHFTLAAWFFLSFIGGFLNSVSISVQGIDNDRIMVNYLRTDARLYTQARITVTVLADVLLYLPYVVAAMIIGNIPVWCTLPMLIAFAASHLAGNMVNMLFFRFTKKHFGIPPYSFVFVIVLAAAAYFPVYRGVFDWQALLSNPLVWILSILLGAAAWLYIDKYRLHEEMIRERIGRIGDMINKARSRNNTGDIFGNQSDAAKWNKDIDTHSLKSDKHKNKTGFAYLNAVFFDRHSNFYRKKMLTRCAICLAPVLLAAAFTLYNITFGDGGSVFEGREIPFHFAPLFFFIIYFASMGRVVTGSVFANCDIHMLHYTYYRTKETTAASFKSRFAVILLFNVIISLFLAVSILGAAWLLFGYMDYTLACIFFVLLLLIGLFFAFNDLFLYYVIQPYDSTGQSKSIIYVIINFIIYIFAYINMQIRLDLINYSIFIGVLTAIYLALGVVLLAVLAPKKFKLR